MEAAVGVLPAAPLLTKRPTVQQGRSTKLDSPSRHPRPGKHVISLSRHEDRRGIQLTVALPHGFSSSVKSRKLSLFVPTTIEAYCTLSSISIQRTCSGVPKRLYAHPLSAIVHVMPTNSCTAKTMPMRSFPNGQFWMMIENSRETTWLPVVYTRRRRGISRSRYHDQMRTTKPCTMTPLAAP